MSEIGILQRVYDRVLKMKLTSWDEDNKLYNLDGETVRKRVLKIIEEEVVKNKVVKIIEEDETHEEAEKASDNRREGEDLQI